MLLKKWDILPSDIRKEAVKDYYELLKKHKLAIVSKRLFDIIVSLILLILLIPAFIIIGVVVFVASPGNVFFVQKRFTQYGKLFNMYKFRTMVKKAESMGSQVTLKNDPRVIPMGRILRKFRLDELPQLINVLIGDMSFVGTRPEVSRYVEKYSDEMMATLLLPAGITSYASILYKDEEKLLSECNDAASADRLYIEKILPEKMKYNLEYLKNFSFKQDLKIMVNTVTSVLFK